MVKMMLLKNHFCENEFGVRIFKIESFLPKGWKNKFPFQNPNLVNEEAIIIKDGENDAIKESFFCENEFGVRI